MSEKEKSERRDKIVAGLESAYAKLIEFKKAKKSPLVVSQGNAIVEIDANDVPSETKYLR